GHNKLTGRCEGIKKRSEKTPTGGASHQPRHEEEAQRSQAVDEARDGLKGELGRYPAYSGPRRDQPRDQRRIGKLKRYPAVPKRPPVGMEPTGAVTFGKRHQEAVHGVNTSCLIGKQLMK